MQNITATTHAIGSADFQSSARSCTVQPRVRQAAEEFEAQMMKELLKPMTSDSLSGESDEDGAGSTGALGEFASEVLGKALSAGGGFGIAHRIVEALSKPGTTLGAAQGSKRCPQANTELHSQ